MCEELNLSEARRQLSNLLRRIETDPDTTFRIKVRDKVIAELRAPEPRDSRVNSGDALLRAAEQAEKWYQSLKRKRKVTPESYKEYLYGDRGVLGSRRRP